MEYFIWSAEIALKYVLAAKYHTELCLVKYLKSICECLAGEHTQGTLYSSEADLTNSGC